MQMLTDKSASKATELLTEIYREVYPDLLLVEVPTIPHESWRLLGFQQDNPLSDLRASGVVGLAYLNWYLKSEQHRDEGKRTLIEQQNRLDASRPDAINHFPFAIVSFSILLYILSEYKIVDKYNRVIDESLWAESKKTFTIDGAFEDATRLFKIFHVTWNEKNASYMDFPVIFEEAKIRFST